MLCQPKDMNPNCKFDTNSWSGLPLCAELCAFAKLVHSEGMRRAAPLWLLGEILDTNGLEAYSAGPMVHLVACAGLCH